MLGYEKTFFSRYFSNFQILWCLIFLIEKSYDLWMLGTKYPPAEVHIRSNPPGILPTSGLRRHLSEPPRWPSLHNVPKFCRRINPYQCQPDSPQWTDSIQVSTVVDHLLDFVQTPTGVGPLPQTPTTDRLHPDSYGSRISSPNSNCR